MRTGGGASALERHAGDAVEAVRARCLEDPVRLVLDPARDIGVGGTAVGRVVLEAAVLGRVVRRRHDDAVGEAAAGRTVAVGDEDRVRDRGGRRVAVGGIDADVHPVRDQHLERRPPRRLGERVRVAADEQRPGVALGGPIAADGLGRGQDVRLVERGLERRTAVAGRAERDPLGRIGRVGADVVVRGDEGVDVDEVRRERRAARRAGGHSSGNDTSRPVPSAFAMPAVIARPAAVPYDAASPTSKHLVRGSSESVARSAAGCMSPR